MTPQQLEPCYFSDKNVSPEYVLWLKVLEMGIYEASQYFKTATDLTNESICNIHLSHIRQAVRWILSDSYYPGSFYWVCEVVGHDPKKIRHEITALN